MKKNMRSFIERRSLRDRRRLFSFRGLSFRKQNRRLSPERRLSDERRENWVRVSRWSGAPLKHLKISKYILRKTGLTKNDPYP